MRDDKLIMMANQIATFFAGQPGSDQAVRIAAHLSDFWDPSMRRHLDEMVAAGRAGALHPLAAEAVTHLRSGTPAAAQTFG